MGDEFEDAFLDSTYLKLDEGALAFIFTKERVQAALGISGGEAQALLDKHRDEMVRIYGETTKRILMDAFWHDLFEDLFEREDEVVFAFINLALGRIKDKDVEAARVAEVKKYQARLKKK
ncbi:MAG: hypothetical protein K8I27_10850 [Planctomycetes bacterium]|nr:hypothetical protein [Planctomycetota bacterium]